MNAAGAATRRSDRTLPTTKVPLSLAILASPNPVLFGGTVTVQGTLSGTGNAGRAVVLQANVRSPSRAGFQNLGNPELTNATGGFSFPVLALALVTQFRVVDDHQPAGRQPGRAGERRGAGRKPRRPRAGARGLRASSAPSRRPRTACRSAILRIARGRGVLVGGTMLRHRDAASSQFSRVVPVRRGIYRVLVRVTSGALVSNYGTPLVIR